jgi:hypothetical protein
MNTDATIRRLVGDLRPVPPRWSDSARFALWGLVLTAGLAFEAIVAAWRGAAPRDATLATWFLRAILPLALALVAAAAALQSSIPGRAHRAWAAATLLLWLLWTGVLAAATAADPLRSATDWLAEPAVKCAAHIAASGLPGGLLLLWLVRCGAPLSVARTGILIALAAAASGALATLVTCPNRSAAHELLWHAGPVIAIAIAGAGASRWLGAWNRTAG